jgi:hypothetical protein
MKNAKRIFIASLSFFVAACGGGGGGSGSPALNPIDNNRNIKPVIIQTYDPIPGDIIAPPNNDIFAKDLNGSGAEEVVIAGRSSQSFDMDTDDVSDWQNYEMQVFGWNTGDFGNETATWFTSNENSILGTEPSVHFGDFDGDGNVDMSVAHGTDMELYGPSHVYFNTGSSSFERTSINHEDTWAHESAVGDFNDDGFDDFLIGSFSGNMSLAFGSADRTFDLYQATSSPVGVGLAVGDFLNDGSVTIVSTGGSNNQELYSWATVGDELQLSLVSNLPDSRFELSKWDDERADQVDEYHTIRAVTFDFDGNGVDDVITITTLDKDDNVHGYTEVQFLNNDGSGNFTDVTDDVLRDFDTNQIATYNPVLVDVNNDGLLDLMLSTRAFADEPSTSVLVQGSDGTFTERYVDEFAAYNDTLNALGGDDSAADPSHSIVAGPDGKRYLVSVGPVNTDDGDYENRVFLSEIGNNGTITTASTISALKSQWPWMTDAQANEILSFTASDYVDGMPVIDYRDAMSPIGGLSLKVDSGKWFNQIKGHVSGIYLTEQVSVLAQDNTSRTFAVDLSTSVFATESTWSSLVDNDNQNQTDYTVQSSNLVNGESFSSHGITIQQDSNVSNYRISLPSVALNKNTFLTASFTDLDFSPWLSMSGMWGSINKTNITEGTLTIKKENWVMNTGLMHTATEIESGLITSVNDIYAAWGDFGWQHENRKFGLLSGIDPLIVSGSVNVSLPESVDDKGNLIYNKSTIPLISEESFYVRAFFNEDIHDNLTMKTSAVLRNNGVADISVDFEWDF